VFERAAFKVPPLLTELEFEEFWGPVMQGRQYAQPCLRTLYCQADTSTQVTFKETALYIATVQWLVAGGSVSGLWLHTRLLEAAKYYGIPAAKHDSILSGRLARGATELARKYPGVFGRLFGPPGRIPLGGGRRVHCWAGEGDIHGVATWEGGGPTGVLDGRVDGRKYLPDVLLTKRAGLWATLTGEDGMYAMSMRPWGGVRVVESREEYWEGGGPGWVCVAVGGG
jgi:hypothetical protein